MPQLKYTLSTVYGCETCIKYIQIWILHWQCIQQHIKINGCTKAVWIQTFSIICKHSYSTISINNLRCDAQSTSSWCYIWDVSSPLPAWGAGEDRWSAGRLWEGRCVAEVPTIKSRKTCGWWWENGDSQIDLVIWHVFVHANGMMIRSFSAQSSWWTKPAG